MPTRIATYITHHENAAREKFSCVFEQLLHTDKLPTEPIAHIQLKNPGTMPAHGNGKNHGTHFYNSTLPQVGSNLSMPLPDLLRSLFPKLTLLCSLDG
jgi:hypothetical protein